MMSRQINQCATALGWICCNQLFKLHKDISAHIFNHFTITACINCATWDSDAFSLLERHQPNRKHSLSVVCIHPKFFRFDEVNWMYATQLHSMLPNLYPSINKL